MSIENTSGIKEIDQRVLIFSKAVEDLIKEIYIIVRENQNLKLENASLRNQITMVQQNTSPA